MFPDILHGERKIFQAMHYSRMVRNITDG
jgi:hypothetical protein